jgi:hypothetical protein
MSVMNRSPSFALYFELVLKNCNRLIRVRG